MRLHVREVLQLLRVRVMIVEFASFCSLPPFSVAPPRRAQAVTEESFARGLRLARLCRPATASLHLRERPPAARRCRIAQHGHKALTLEIVRWLHAAEFSQGRKKIDQPNRRLRHATAFAARRNNEQRNPRTLLEQAHLLP